MRMHTPEEIQSAYEALGLGTHEERQKFLDLANLGKQHSTNPYALSYDNTTRPVATNAELAPNLK